MRAIWLLGLVLTACGVHEEGSEVEFIGYNQVGRSPLGYLITKVHRPKWTIGYYYGERCGVRPKEKIHRSTLDYVLRTWLKPLNDMPSIKREIVNRINYKNIQHQNKEDLNNFDLVVEYACDYETSHAFSGNPPRIVMMKGIGQSLDKGGYSIAVLLHEVGHAFGLMDTYVLKNKAVSGESYDFFNDTLGNQPPSVMSAESSLQPYNDATIELEAGQGHPPYDPNRKPIIYADDTNGLKWIYLNYHSKNNLDNADDCYFPGYELELLHRNGHRGCAPSNPLIFMLKNGYSARLLRDKIIYDTSIRPLLNKKENSGNQLYPLHYAAMTPREKLLPIFTRWYKETVYAVADINVADRRGLTPLHYAIRAGNKRIAYSILGGHPNSDHVFPRSANVNIKANNGMTPLHFAVQFADVETTCYLLAQSDINVTLEDRWGLTAEERANTRIRHWRRKKNQKMITKMEEVISVFEQHKYKPLKTWKCRKDYPVF